MAAGSWVLAVWGALTSAVWCGLALYGLRASFRFKKFSELDAPDPGSWPRLSVIVAACDEEATIGPALQTLLAQDYPDLEIVVVDDRSRDATGRIVDEAAAADARIRPVHVRELPPGWIGKVHALDRGTAASSGAWLLYTDADVHFAPDALRRAVAHVQAHGLDHLAVAPDLYAPGFLQDVVSAAFATAFMIGTRAVDVGRKGSKAYAGVGAFNLVRRNALDRTPGFSWLRLEVLDDVGLGLMLRNAGAKGAFAIGVDHVWVTWYRSLGAMARGLEKNMFGAFCRYRLRRLFGFVVGAAVFLPGPLVALAASPRPLLPSIGIAVIALVLVNAIVLAARTRRPILPFLLAPAGGAILAVLVLRSAWRCLRDGGVTWRGTLYPLRELREGQRVRL
jgi:cellulose synthase/poly-beta-1,6-N-acetylglucosamine synthase-like glycosyltransferase